MTGWLRVLLIAGALVVMTLVLWKIRKAQMRIADSTFWFLFSGIVVVFAVFPQVPFFFSFLIGIDSPSNFVFLFVIAALFVHEFYLTVELSRLRAKVARFVQTDALREAEHGGMGTERARSAEGAVASAAAGGPELADMVGSAATPEADDGSEATDLPDVGEPEASSEAGRP